MPVNVITRRFPEIGRIRLGDRGGTNKAPRRLAHFRLTSQDAAPLAAAAKLWGGSVQKWEQGGEEGRYQLYTTVAELPVRVIVNQPLSQWLELWSGGGCQRRCDGITEIIGNTDCLCDPEKRECSLKTRFSVLLPEIPGVGSWRVETGGYYAAIELPGLFELLTAHARAGSFPPATLAIEARERKVPGKPTKKFSVVTIRIHETIATLLGGPQQAAIATENAPRVIEAVACTCGGPKHGKPHLRNCPAYVDAVDGPALAMEVQP